MKKQISPDNPFGPCGLNRITWAYGFESITDGMRILDYGCNDGAFVEAIASRKRVEAFGVEKDRDVVTRAGKRNVLHIERDIPFESGTIDAVTLFDVFEHVHDQDYLLREIHRVLKPHGLVIVTVPRRYIFSCLDLGNLKYRFPLIHKLYYRVRHTQEEYLYRYVNNPYGLVGCVDKEKGWHQHFREDELVSQLQRSGLMVFDIDGSGLIGDLINFLGCFGLGFLFTKRLHDWETWNFETRMLYCTARKSAAISPRHPS